MINRVLIATALLGGFFALYRLGNAALWELASFCFTAVLVYEWARLLGARGRGGVIFVLLFAFLALAARAILLDNFAARDAFLGFALAVWGVFLPCWLLWRFALPSLPLASLGLLFPLAAWLAAAVLYREYPGVLLAALAVVWATDSGAFLGGRLFGARPLSSISPKKTWEGVFGGGATVAIFVTAAIVSGGAGEDRASVVLLFAAAFCAFALAVGGDLFESMIKRRAATKDSGALLGSHGGVFDRLDACLPVLPFAALVAPWVSP